MASAWAWCSVRLELLHPFEDQVTHLVMWSVPEVAASSGLLSLLSCGSGCHAERCSRKRHLRKMNGLTPISSRGIVSFRRLTNSRMIFAIGSAGALIDGSLNEDIGLLIRVRMQQQLTQEAIEADASS